MAEDDMEISSEHGHNDGDEDIDIDIDFAAPRTDEDHVLEDIASYEDVEEIFSEQAPAPDFPDDEEMVDEDNQSYLMDDADILHEYGAPVAPIDEADLLHDQESPAAVEYDAEIFHREASVTAPGDAEIFYDDETQAATADGGASIPYNEEVPNTNSEMASPGIDAVGSTENITGISTTKADDNVTRVAIDLDHSNEEGQEILPAYTDHQAYPHDPKNSGATTPVELTEAGIQHEVATSVLDDHSTLDTEALEEPQNSVYIHKSGGNSPASTTFVDTERAEQNLDEGNEGEQYSSFASATIPNVIVSWDGKDYPLFSTSESDDPDSYFLSDTSILDKPLARFLESIREVIHGDLGDEDELVLSIDDLGLEISESANRDTRLKGAPSDLAMQTNTSVQSMSLSRIMNLRRQLLRNDGVSNEGDESLDLLFISITVKKSFSKRLSKLIAGAAEGKGLSDFWEEHPLSLVEGDELEHQYEPESGAESLSTGNATHGEANKELGGESEDHVEGKLVENGSQNGQILASRDPEPSLALSEDAQEPEILKASSESGEPHNQANAKSALEVDVAKTDLVRESDIDEGNDDVIDYSDEELESGDGQKDVPRPETVIDRQENECSELLLAEYDQINKDLDRRSRSRLSDENQVVELKPLALDSTEAVGEEQGDAAKEVFGDAQCVTGAFNRETEADLSCQDHGCDIAANDTSLEQEDYGTSHADDGSSGGGASLGDDVGFDHGNDGEENIGLTHHFDTFEADPSFRDEGELEGELEGSSLGEEVISKNIGPFPEQSKEDEASDHTSNSAAGSPAVLETAESSVTLDVDDEIYDEDVEEQVVDDPGYLETGLLTGGATLEVKDEIDYEDDEEEVEERLVIIRDGYSPPQIKESSPANGKRTIAEVDSDEALDTRANNVKRPRS